VGQLVEVRVLSTAPAVVDAAVAPPALASIDRRNDSARGISLCLSAAQISDGNTVDRLRKGIFHLYSSSDGMRVSSALYLFKDDRWTVFQPPHAE
jgi:hypothetical protein